MAGQSIKLLDHFIQDWVTRTEGLTRMRLTALGLNCIRQKDKGRYIRCNPNGKDIFELPYSYIYINKRMWTFWSAIISAWVRNPLVLPPSIYILGTLTKINSQWLRKRLPYAAVWEKSWNKYDYSSKQNRLSALRPADAGLRYVCRCQTDQPPICDTAISGASGKLPPATLRSGASNRMLALERADRLVDTTGDIILRIMNV
jgi:hypothetical protein